MSNILGFPANNFREQKPGSDDEIAEFCKATYAIDFPMFRRSAWSATTNTRCTQSSPTPCRMPRATPTACPPTEIAKPAS